VVENWYQNKAVVDSIEALSQAVQDADHIEDSLGMVYTPMAYDDFHKIASENIDEMNAGGWLNLYEVYGKAIERAVAERCGKRVLLT